MHQQQGGIMKLPAMMIVGTTMVSLCCAAIEEKAMVVSAGMSKPALGLDISKAAAVPASTDCDSQPTSPQGACVLPRCQSSDLFFRQTGLWDDFKAGCGGSILAIVSYDTIWELKKPQEMDFTRPLVLSDTSLFSYAPRNHASPCSTWQVQCPYFENICSRPSWSMPAPVWYLAKTREGAWFIFRFSNRQSSRDSAGILDGEVVTVKAILQTDGSLNFRNAAVAALNPVQAAGVQRGRPGQVLVKRFGDPGACGVWGKAYDVRGRLIAAPSAKSRSVKYIPMVYIVKSKAR
jgi:hypothetical protein